MNVCARVYIHFWGMTIYLQCVTQGDLLRSTSPREDPEEICCRAYMVIFLHPSLRSSHLGGAYELL